MKSPTTMRTSTMTKVFGIDSPFEAAKSAWITSRNTDRKTLVKTMISNATTVSAAVSISDPRPPPGSSPVTNVTIAFSDWNIAHTAAAMTDPPSTMHIAKITKAAGKNTTEPRAIEADGLAAYSPRVSSQSEILSRMSDSLP